MLFLDGVFAFFQQVWEALQEPVAQLLAFLGLLVVLAAATFVRSAADELARGLVRRWLEAQRRRKARRARLALRKAVSKAVDENADGETEASCQEFILAAGARLLVCVSKASGRRWIRNTGERPLKVYRGSKRFALGVGQIAAWTPEVPPVVEDPATGAVLALRRHRR